MFGIGSTELLIVGFVCLLLFGNRLVSAPGCGPSARASRSSRRAWKELTIIQDRLERATAARPDLIRREGQHHEHGGRSRRDCACHGTWRSCARYGIPGCAEMSKSREKAEVDAIGRRQWRWPGPCGCGSARDPGRRRFRADNRQRRFGLAIQCRWIPWTLAILVIVCLVLAASVWLGILQT